MTREARLAAGWVECWGVYDWTDRNWIAEGGGWTGTVNGPTRRSLSLHDALETASNPWPSKCEIAPRRFWRRKKPKAPPPLAVGDEVVVRGRILEFGVALCLVETASGRPINPRVSDCERVKP